jgi:hypothetical protein
MKLQWQSLAETLFGSMALAHVASFQTLKYFNQVLSFCLAQDRELRLMTAASANRRYTQGAQNASRILKQTGICSNACVLITKQSTNASSNGDACTNNPTCHS